MGPHEIVGIVQTIIYAPLVPISIGLLYANWAIRPRSAWYPAVPLSLIRFIGGILTIITEERMRQHKETQTLIIVTIVFLNIGLIPLLLALSGFARLVVDSSIQGAGLGFSLMKLCILLVAGLLAAAGSMAGQPDNASLQRNLSIAAYTLFTIVFIILVCTFIATYLRDELEKGVMFYVKGALLASIFVAIRTVYSLLGVSLASGANILTSTWSPLFGSAWAFSLMALIPEYFALVIFLYLAWHQYTTSKAAIPLTGSDIELPRHRR